MNVRKAIIAAIRYRAAQVGLIRSHVPSTFVIVAGPRSGSTLLHRLLDEHPSLICMHELSRERPGTPDFSRYFLGSRKRLARLRARNASNFLDTLYSARHPESVVAVGFKALYTQPSKESGNWEGFWDALGNVRGLKVIHLRRNRLECVLSLRLAMHSDRWTGKEYDQSQIEVDPDWVLWRLRKEQRLENAALQKLGASPVTTLDYNKLVSDFQQVCNGIFAFLDVSNIPVALPLKKQRTRKLSLLISNWPEIEAVIKHSEFSNLLLELDGH